MEYNIISDVLLTRNITSYFISYLLSIQNTINLALSSHDKYNFSHQTTTSWLIASSWYPNPLDQAIHTAKSIIASRHVSIYEEWKGIQCNEADAEVQWPKSKHGCSLWSQFHREMDDGHAIYQLRNWFCHEFGRRNTVLDLEKERSDTLLKAYQKLLPLLGGLITKLEAALEDDGAWAEISLAQARLQAGVWPEYGEDCAAVKEAIRAEEEKLRLERIAHEESFKAMILRSEVEGRARSARSQEGAATAWPAEDWIQTEVEESVWYQEDKDLGEAKIEKVDDSASGNDVEEMSSDDEITRDGFPCDFAREEQAYESRYDDKEQNKRT